MIEEIEDHRGWIPGTFASLPIDAQHRALGLVLARGLEADEDKRMRDLNRRARGK